MDKLLPIAGVIFFPVLWVCISLLLSHLGGWVKLAAHYPAQGDEVGETYYLRSGYVGAVNYKSCLSIRVCKSGLRLSVSLPFRIGHPPLFIPWDQFHDVSEKRRFVVRLLETNVGRPVIAKLVLPYWLSKYLPADRSCPSKETQRAK